MLPMSKFSTLNYLINSYYAGKKEEKVIHLFDFDEKELEDMDLDVIGYEPSQSCIDAILGFALQFDVLKSGNVGSIELNLN